MNACRSDANFFPFIFIQKISLIFSDEAPSGGTSSSSNVDCGLKSSTLRHSTSLKYSFDNLNSLQNTPNMKILSKINSISSLNDKNLEKFTMTTTSSGAGPGQQAANNNRFLATKSYIDFLHHSQPAAATTSLTYDTAQLGSAKNLKLNAADDTSVSSMFWSAQKSSAINDRPLSTYWDDKSATAAVQQPSSLLDSLQQQTKDKPALFSWSDAIMEPSSATLVQMDDAGNMTVTSKPQSTLTNLRNTVSSSNLALNINYSDSQPPPPPSSCSANAAAAAIPMIIPQKFQFNQPQSQPMMKNSSSSGSHDVMAMSAGEQQQLSSRKSSLPHTSSLLTSNNINNNNNSNFKEIITGELVTSATTKSPASNGSAAKLLTAAAQSASSSSSTPVMLSSSAPSSASLHPTSSSSIVASDTSNGSGATSNSNDIKNSQKWPVVASPHQVMMLYMNKLTPYEHHEIYKYPQIYFIGANAKKRPGVGANNSDYDNENGSYIHIPHDHIAYRYEVLKIIGKGSFGSVVKAYDHKNREHVALKMVRNEKRFHRQAQEEIRILKHLRAQDKENAANIIHM